MKSKTEPTGLGGWLIPQILGLIVQPFHLANILLMTYVPMFLNGYWSTITNPCDEGYNLILASIIIYKIAIKLCFFTASIFLLVLCFQKHYRFPKSMILILILGPFFLGLDIPIASFFLAIAPDSESIIKVLVNAVAAVVWILYFLKSTRVKNTFVKHRKASAQSANHIKEN